MPVNRRSFLRTGLAASAAAALGGRAARSAPAKPNILLILTDDMGFSDLGCYGGEIRTPNLDKLAEGGLRFTQFYNTARCCPTRASLLTGLYPHQAGVGHMVDSKGLDGFAGQLSPDAVTIPEALRGAGYRNYMVGKWHVCHDINPEGDRSAWPMQRGFDRYYGTLAGAGSYYDPAALCRDNQHISAGADPEYQPAEPFYYTTALGDQGARFITEHARQSPDTPFFLYAAFTAAHWPLHAPESALARTRGRYDGGYESIRQARLERLRRLGIVHADWRPAPTVGNWEAVPDKAWEARCMEVYAAQVEMMDAAVGRLVEALRASGALDNTLILFMQDNGACAEAVGRGGNERRGTQPTLPTMAKDAVRLDGRPKQTRDGWPVLGGPQVMPGPADTFESYGQAWANVSNTPFREYKHWVHEGGISTPLIAHWPRGIRRGGELEHQPGHLIDIWATCVDVAGAKPPTERAGKPVPAPEGRSLVTAFAGRAIAREALFWEHEGNRALRVGPWKLVAKSPGGAWELYNMDADRTELDDLTTRLPDRAAQMAAAWESWAKRTKALPWPWKPAYGQPAAASRTSFDLKSGDRLVDDEAPSVARRPFTVTATFDAQGKDGVIVAQGGNNHGWSLYVKDGRLEAALRRAGALTVVTAAEPLPAGRQQATLALVRGGGLTLSLGGRVVAEGKAGGLLPEQPKDALEVGCDTVGAVGQYKAPGTFGGKVEAVKVEVGPG
ncbi:MAG: arylsulfatase [Armatimonadetes bacterium]|nr:arylsulfatase [Armatimonadota bacterium]